jgi:hypothetical protein
VDGSTLSAGCARLDRLDDVVVGTRFQSGDLVEHVNARRQDQHGYARKTANAAADLHAVHVRQHQIENHQCRFMFAHGGHGRVAAPHDRHAEFIAVQIFPDQLRETIVVLDQQHAGFEGGFVHVGLHYQAPILSARTRAGCAANTREHLNTIAHTFPQLQDRRGEAASLDCGFHLK